MSRPAIMLVVALATLLLASCGGGSDEAEPEATRATTTPTPTVAPQPQGADGVTYEVSNWSTYADDPAVLGYKRAVEASGASINKHKLVPDAVTLLSKPLQRLVRTNLDNGKGAGWTVQDVAHGRVVSARTVGTKARLVTCEWAPSTDIYNRDGKLIGDVKREWRKLSVSLTSRKGTWVLQQVKQIGTCPGGAPA